MPFKSLAQERFMYAKHPELAQKYAAHTPSGAVLPEKVEKPAQFTKLPKRPRYGEK